MQKAVKKSDNKVKSKEKDEAPPLSRKPQDEKLKKGVNNVSTPRNFIQKSSTTDIYAQKKNATSQSVRAPKKVPTGSKTSNASPMKDLLKSSPSSVSQISTKSSYDKNPIKKRVESKVSLDTSRKTTPRKVEAKASVDSARKSTAKTKDLPFTSVTVNSPAAKRKLYPNQEPDKFLKRIDSRESFRGVKNLKSLERGDSDEVDKIVGRQRTKTRTLNEAEVKVLTPETVDNNAEMLNLARRLSAKPKAFYIDLDEDKSKASTDKVSDEDVSYEDDFESYESDFESYHSEDTGSSSHKEHASQDSSDEPDGIDLPEGSKVIEVKDEEKMLDSGSFELRESQRSANKSKPAVMEFILEDSEDMKSFEDASDKRSSLTDEGFQEMSNSSMKTQHVDALDRPLFIDFTKSKENRRKRRICERLKQRARDVMSMITLHEMSYSLYEMKPIAYDLYMATFGKSNYTQISVQTFDDGITEEVQTEDILTDHKWSQHPVEFSNDVVYLKDPEAKKYGQTDEDFLGKFSFLVNQKLDDDVTNEINKDKDYENNPLRIYLEQKDGVGFCEMLPYEKYKSKISNNDFNVNKLGKFLKRVERNVSRVLSKNAGNTELTDLVKTSKLPFSKGYVSIDPKSMPNDDQTLNFLNSADIEKVCFSDSKSNLLMTTHRKTSSGAAAGKCVICLWDIGVARREPIKILVAIDNVTICRFRGGTDGTFIAALEDGSIHLWDLAEEPTWRTDVGNEHSTNLVEDNSERLTQTEKDREWNLKNSHVGVEQPPLQCHLQSCAYTNSASNMNVRDVSDSVVGLEFVGDARSSVTQDGGRKIVGQICSLQMIGLLTIWSVVQEKSKSTTPDIGKAYWSKIKLEKTQNISLIEQLDVPTRDATEQLSTCFNLNAAKRRLSNRKQEKNSMKRQNSRPKSAITTNSEFDIAKPYSAANSKNTKVLPEKNILRNWEGGVVCNDLKIMRIDKIDNYLVAKNCGEVLCCLRNAGAVKINRFCVSSDTSSVTCIEVSPHGLPYFLAATDSGTVNLCSLVNARVLLTLDCRNVPLAERPDKCVADYKGRYVSSVTPSTNRAQATDLLIGSKMLIKSVQWSRKNPCCLYVASQDGVAVWELTHSDICARCVCAGNVQSCVAGDGTLALVTSSGEVQIHRLVDEQRNMDYVNLFQKYVTLL